MASKYQMADMQADTVRCAADMGGAKDKRLRSGRGSKERSRDAFMAAKEGGCGEYGARGDQQGECPTTKTKGARLHPHASRAAPQKPWGPGLDIVAVYGLSSLLQSGGGREPGLAGMASPAGASAPVCICPPLPCPRRPACGSRVYGEGPVRSPSTNKSANGLTVRRSAC